MDKLFFKAKISSEKNFQKAREIFSRKSKGQINVRKSRK
jgi:hypothetical protein